MPDLETPLPAATELPADPSKKEPVDDTQDEGDAVVQAVDDGKGNKMVGLGVFLEAKKSVKALNKKVKELEAVAARTTEVEDRLNKTAPIVNAILQNPKLAAEVTRMTRQSAPGTEQPAPDEDVDAREYAEIQGWYVSDTGELDIRRGRRALDFAAKGYRHVAEEIIRPLAGTIIGDRADGNLQRIYGMRDEHGLLLATRESINQIVTALGQDGRRLLADPQVADIVINSAIGLDHRQGRKPPAPVDDPLLLEHAGGRGPRGAVLTADDRRVMEKLGLSEDDVKRADQIMTRRGTRLE